MRGPRIVVLGVVDLPEVQEQLTPGTPSWSATERSAATGRKLATPCWIAIPSSSLQHFVDASPPASVSTTSRGPRPSAREDVARQHHRPSVGVRTRSMTSDVLARLEPEPLRPRSPPRARSSAAPARRPACIPRCRIASVTPKFMSRLFGNAPRCGDVRAGAPDPPHEPLAARATAAPPATSPARRRAPRRARFGRQPGPTASRPRSIRSVSSTRTVSARLRLSDNSPPRGPNTGDPGVSRP